MTQHFDFLTLTPAERIDLIEEIWDSLDDSETEAPLTATQKKELERRFAAADRGEITYSSWEDVKRRVFREE
jgi:putative addiction module component (TIGR02574 family)